MWKWNTMMARMEEQTRENRFNWEAEVFEGFKMKENWNINLVFLNG